MDSRVPYQLELASVQSSTAALESQLQQPEGRDKWQVLPGKDASFEELEEKLIRLSVRKRAAP